MLGVAHAAEESPASDRNPLEAKFIALALALFSFPVVLGALVWIYPAAGRAAHAFGLA